MIDVDDHDLAHELTAVFERAAAMAPLSTPVWRGPVDVSGAPRHTVRNLAAAAAAVGLVAGGVVAVTMAIDGPKPDTRSVVSAPVEPPPTDPPPPSRGAELSFVPVEATPELADTFEVIGLAPIRPGSLVAASYEGYPVVFYTTITATSSEVIELRCGGIGPAGNGVCSPVTQVGSSQGMAEGADGFVWFWLGVPARTAYVRASVDGDSYWERPVGNAAVFPASETRTESFAPWPVLGDAGGPTDTSLPPPAEATSSTPGDPLPDEVRDAAQTAVRTTAKACLDDAGIGDPFETPDPAIDVDELWNECVLEAADALGAVLADGSEPSSDSAA